MEAIDRDNEEALCAPTDERRGASSMAPTAARVRARPPAWLDRALTYLAWTQQIDGEVPIRVASNAGMVGEAVFDSNLFGTAIVLHALRGEADHRACRLRRRAAAFLTRWAEPGGLWRFWSPKAGRAVDPDLDVTAVVAAALRGHDPTLVRRIDPDALLQYRNQDGHFLTWARGPSARNDVDAVVNANVLWWLRDHPGTGAAARLVVDTLRADHGAHAHPYYENIIALCFAAARAIAAGSGALDVARRLIVERIRERRDADGHVGSAFDTAMALAALRYLGSTVDAGERHMAAWLLAQQRDDGSWPVGAAWNGPEWPSPRTLWWGSEALTTAVAIGALRDHGEVSSWA